MLLQPKNWATFQHYKDRCPPWIKLHRDLLINREFMCLPLASKAIAPLLWLLASESKDGSFEASPEELQFRLHLSVKDINDGLKPLIDKGFFIPASGMLAECYQDAIPETEAEIEKETKKETEKKPSASEIRFDRFWKAYPKKVGKFDAQKSFEKRKVDDTLLEKMLRAIDTQSQSDSWRKDNGQFIPNPSTWINQGRWEDEGVTVASAPPVNKGPDPALMKIEADRQKAVPMPDHIRKQIMSVVRKV